MIRNIDHIAIAVSDLEEALEFWRDTLGLKLTHREEVPSQQVDTAFFEIGTSKIELVEPTTEDSGIARFVKKNGSTLHHIALEVEDLSSMLLNLKSKGLHLLNDVPVDGAGGKRAIFIHPNSTGGVLVELYESVPT
jgi:methylmalonyl-CoA/ethylmalonyl-CoA epimerase